MNDIFVSYASEDRQKVGPIVAALQQRSWTVFWDRKIPPGKKWEDVLYVQLKQARCVVVLWSRNSINSEWVRHEAGIARYRQILVPVLLDHDLQAESDIPAIFREIQSAKLVTLSDAPDADFSPLITAVSHILSKRWLILKIAAAAFFLAGLSFFAARHVELAVKAEQTGLMHLEHDKYKSGENERLAEAIRNGSKIKLLVGNANSFQMTFSNDLRAFFAKPSSSMQVIFADPTSESYKEATQMTYGKDWNMQDKPDAVTGNMNRVATSRQILTDDANGQDKIEFRYFHTQFRLPVIIVDDKYCFLTVRLPPDEGAKSLRLEFEGPGYTQSCVAHFDRMWELSSKTTPKAPNP